MNENTVEENEELLNENEEQQSSDENAEETVDNNREKTVAEVEAEWKDKFTRLYSEFENFRRRTAKEKLELINTASSDVIKDLLTVLDDFDRAIASNETSEDVEGIKEGFNLIHEKLYKSLEKKGLNPMNLKDKEFDPEVSEAIARIPMPDKQGVVIDEVERGYLINDKIIRFAKVVVGQ